MRLLGLRTLFLGIALSACLLSGYEATAIRQTRDADSAQTPQEGSSDQSGSSEVANASDESSTSSSNDDGGMMITSDNNLLDDVIYLLTEILGPGLKPTLDLLKSLPVLGPILEPVLDLVTWLRGVLLDLRSSNLVWVLDGALPCEVGMQTGIHCTGTQLIGRLEKVISDLVDSLPDSILPHILKPTLEMVLNDLLDPLLGSLIGSSN